MVANANGTIKTPFSIPDLIRKKRDGKELEIQEIETFIQRITSPLSSPERPHDSQIGAFLMATFLNGMSHEELSALTKAMTYSGYTFSWPVEWKGSVVDKHSTGGVGDKVSLVLAPALAACGLKDPMISGRGLDFTGGTLDKLEAIPGYNVFQSKDRMKEILEEVGCCIVGQTEDIVPADKLLYSLRDITATVEKEELIVASIISKKAAAGLDSLILDVKTGRGAMMKELDASRKLARKLVDVGKSFGMDIVALVTNMDTPLGFAVGNALEVAECILTMQNKGPSDLVELTVYTGAKLLVSAGKCANLKEAQKLMTDVIENGEALKKFKQMMICQGVDPKVANELCEEGNAMWKHLPKARKITEIKSDQDGFIDDIDPLEVARVCHSLGCGRTKPGDAVLFEPGVILRKKLGDKVKKGDVIMEVHEGKIKADLHLERLRKAVRISSNPTAGSKGNALIIDVLE